MKKKEQLQVLVMGQQRQHQDLFAETTKNIPSDYYHLSQRQCQKRDIKTALPIQLTYMANNYKPADFFFCSVMCFSASTMSSISEIKD